MNRPTVAVVLFPDDLSVLESEVAGRAACEYLLENLNECDGMEVRIVSNDHPRPGTLLERYSKLSKCKLSELHTEAWQGRGLLIIDARAWLSRSALADILSCVAGAEHSLKFVESSETLASYRDVMTIAVYLPPEQLHRDPFVREHHGDEQGFERVVKPLSLADADIVACSNLGSTFSALLVTSYFELAELERRLLMERAVAALRQGVRIHDPARVYIRGSLECGSGVSIDSNVIIEGNVFLGNNVKIGANSILRTSRIGDGTQINPFSLVEQSSVGAASFVGPYARIRPGSVIGDNVQIGNYVEIKNSRIGDGSRVNHHTFIGDALLADHVTIGAGTITCNHDGVGTNRTVIERGAYVGSGCNLVAPLRIGENAIVGAGSTIVRDVPGGKLTLARQRQTTIENWRGPSSGRKRT